MDYTKRRMPEQLRVDYEDLTETDKMNIYKGEPFTGFAVGTDYAFGERQVTWEEQYVDGEDLGWLITYHDNLRTIAKGEEITQDTSTLENESILLQLQGKA